MMILIVGLGNPGKKFEKTRHNFGFRVIDEIAANFQFSVFSFYPILNAKISKGKIKEKSIILAKPQTFMNKSGQAVKKLTNDLRLTTNDLWVVHDDIDLPLGKIRISKGRGAAGHKGVQSIIDELKTKDFIRFRLGIRPPTYDLRLTTNDSRLTTNDLRLTTLEKFVLQEFNKKEEKIVRKVIKKTSEAIKFAIIEGIEKAMSKFNKI